jgi:cytochrome c oxidase subunit 2
MKFLVYIAIALVITAVLYIARILELSAALRGEKQWVVNKRDTKLNARLMLIYFFAFMAFVAWQFYEYVPLMLPVAASDIGAEIDWLMNVNMVLIMIIFVLTNAVLFYFAYKYAQSDERKARFYPDNHKLELLWTVVPGIVLAVIIVFGISTWTKITTMPEKDYILIELYPKQFDWTARYAGDDNKLGHAEYKKITDLNPLGVDSVDQASWDDFLIRNEFHIPKGKTVLFQFRSRDVIHSAYFPHFRQQMNCVPGMNTSLYFAATITTDSMRMITGNKEYNYILLCNKICGASHYAMQMNIIVDEPADYEKWYNEKKNTTIFAMTKPVEQAPKEEKPMVTDSTKTDTTNHSGEKKPN